MNYQRVIYTSSLLYKIVAEEVDLLHRKFNLKEYDEDHKKYTEHMNRYIDEAHEDDNIVHLENRLRWREKTAQVLLTYLRLTKNNNYNKMEKYISKELNEYMISKY